MINRRDILKFISCFGASSFVPKIEQNNVPEIKQVSIETNYEYCYALSMLLSNQVDFNINQLDYKVKYSIPIIKNLFNNWITPKLFGLQPLNNKTGMVYYLDKTNIDLSLNESKIQANINEKNYNRFFKRNDTFLDILIDDKYCEYEKELIQVISQQIALSIDRENIHNVMNNVGTISCFNFKEALGDTVLGKTESLFGKIKEVFDVIYSKTISNSHLENHAYCGSNWVLTSPQICSMFQICCQNFKPSQSSPCQIGPKLVGSLQGVDFYEDISIKNKLLMGIKTDNAKFGMDVYGGYFYCPHLIFADYSQNKLISSDNSFFQPNGHNYYATINVTNSLI